MEKLDPEVKAPPKYIQSEPEQRGEGIGKQAAPSVPARLLVIEDNPGVQRLIAYCLRDEYRLSFAENGRKGLEQALEALPDLVICDLMMPGMGGYEICRRLKEDSRTSHIPIIILTALDDADSKVKGLECGADAYLAKPFHGRELQVRIEQLLLLRRRLQKVYQQQLTEAEHRSKKRDADKENDFLNRFHQLLHAQLSNPDLSVPDLCRSMGVSHTQLHRKVKQRTGHSAIQLIQSVRMEKARELLRHTTLNVSEIAYQVGYKDPSYFGRVFVKTTGCTPTAFRTRHR